MHGARLSRAHGRSPRWRSPTKVAVAWAALAAAGCAQGGDAAILGWQGDSAIADAGGDDSEAESPGVDGAGPADGESSASDVAPPSDDASMAPDQGALDTGTGDDGSVGDRDDAGSGADAGPDAAGGDAEADAGTDVGSDGAAAGDGGGDASDAGAACSGDLSNVGTGDFHVLFSLTTTLTSSAAIANQRTTCGHGVFWDVRVAAGGGIRAETDDGTNYSNLTSTGATVNDGKSHAVVVKRASGTLSIEIDGVLSGSSPSTSALTKLAPLETTSDPCVGTSGTVAFQGTLSAVCAGAD